MSYPYSLIACLVYVYVLIVLYVLSGRHPFLKKLFSAEAALVIGAVWLVEMIVLGFRSEIGMTRSWHFTLVMAVFGGICLMRAIDDVRKMSPRMIPRAVSHAAMALILLAALFGRGDKCSVEAACDEGVLVTEGTDEQGQSVSLPFGIRLQRFVMEEYPPRLALSGPGGERIPGFVGITAPGDAGTIGTVSLEVLEYLPAAGQMPDSTGYIPMTHVGTAPAARIRATDTATGLSAEGWVSCGSFLFAKAELPLGDFSVRMPRRMPKSFVSEVSLISRGGKERQAVVSVNHPARIGSWKIYQYDYDQMMGVWGHSSVLLCVKDPWYPVIAAGLWMLLLSAAGLILFSRKK